MAPKTPQEIMRGDPISATHQPVQAEMQEWMEYNESAPLVLLVMGQSNVRSNGNSTGGDQQSIDGVYFWNNDASSNNAGGFINGTQYLNAEFGEPPLNIGGAPYANSVAFQAAKKLRLDTGRPVYVIQYGLGGINIESFIDPATVTANGWSTPSQNMHQFLYPGIRNAINAVPGRTGTMIDAFFWIHGGANASDMVEVHAEKLNQLCRELRDGGLIDLQQHPVVAGEITTYGQRDFRKRQVNSYRSAQFYLPTLRIVRTMNAYTTDGLHFTGRFMKEMGRRLVAALYSQPELHDADYEPMGLSVDDGLLSFTYHTTASAGNVHEAPWTPIQSVNSELSIENHASLGWCYTRSSGSGVIVSRKVFPVPVSGCAVFEFEAVSPGTGGVGARVYQYDANGNFIEFSGLFPGGGQIAYNGTPQKHVVRAFPNGQGASFEFHPDAKYFCFGIRYVTTDPDPISFRLHRLDIDGGGVADHVADASSGSAAEINALRDAMIAAGLMAAS